MQVTTELAPDMAALEASFASMTPMRAMALQASVAAKMSSTTSDGVFMQFHDLTPEEQIVYLAMQL